VTREKKILLAVGGGIAAYKAAELVRRLRERGHGVRVALSRSAEAFVTPLTLEVLTGHAVYRQEYLTANGSGEELHITAAQWADAFCAAPATAHLLARLALGLADDFITTTALAFGGPILVAPAMHFQMWGQPAVQQHVQTLIGRGVHFVGPEEGALASGEEGLGRMAAPNTIADALDGLWAPGDLHGRTFLITAGPTREPIDPVRYLGNRSSGKMGFALAAEAAARGARVFLVAGPVQLPTPAGVERVDVGTALEMEAAVQARAGEADVIIMTAAVADFRPRQVSREKIKKGQGTPLVELVPNPDILLGLEATAPHALRMGFAAETEHVERHARQKLERKGAHFIVANDVGRSDIGFRSEENEVTVYRRQGDPILLTRRPKRQVAAALLDLCRDELKQRHERSVGSLAAP
jgi:phosphopantothenoylcysteine decarboxylase/phosphopantothenate--cysteine ligase